MKKSEQKLPLYLIVTSLVVMIVSLISLQSFFSQRGNTDTRSNAAGPPAGGAGNTLTVCTEGCPYAGAAGLQQAFNTAQNGDIINIAPGKYSGDNATPIGLGTGIAVSADRGGSDTCFIRVVGKTVTLKGQNMGSIIYGDGHSLGKADAMPYKTRAGVCVLNGAHVTFDGVRIKEFQKRCMVVYNSNIIVKNSWIEGCDEGGASLLGDSTGIFVNNNIFSTNFGGIMLWQNSQAKIVNNTFYGAHIMFFFHPGTSDKANAEIVNNILSNGTKVTQVDWWPTEAAKLQNIKMSYNLFDKADCTPSLDYCTEFPGKKIGDPRFTAPVIFMGGAEAWSDTSLQGDSPAIGAGDPTIPGPRNIGITGGPCTDPNSSTCTNFISQALSQLAPAATPTEVVPTSAPYIPPANDTQPPANSQPPSNSQQSQPPITYYLPPTMSFSNSNQLNGQNGKQTSETVTPTIAPTPKPIIDIGKTVESAKNTWSNFITSVINFTKTILP